MKTFNEYIEEQDNDKKGQFSVGPMTPYDKPPPDHFEDNYIVKVKPNPSMSSEEKHDILRQVLSTFEGDVEMFNLDIAHSPSEGESLRLMFHGKDIVNTIGALKELGFEEVRDLDVSAKYISQFKPKQFMTPTVGQSRAIHGPRVS